MDWQAHPDWYGMALMTSALFIMPALMRYRRIHKGHKRFMLFYNKAMDEMMKADAAKKGEGASAG